MILIDKLLLCLTSVVKTVSHLKSFATAISLFATELNKSLRFEMCFCASAKMASFTSWYCSPNICAASFKLLHAWNKI